MKRIFFVKMFLVAVTGGIASGKSTVSRMFADLGCPVIDADLIAREGKYPYSPKSSPVFKGLG